MAIAEWQNKMEKQLDLRSGKKQLELSNRRVPVDSNAYHLIIGLGGTGCRALIETKGFIQLTCKDSEQHVAYLAFDTDRSDLQTYRSSSDTGEVMLEEHERQFLDPKGVADMLAPAHIDVTMTTFPEIFEWIDSRIKVPGDGSGANHVRQAGRLLLWNNLTTIRQNLTNTITNLVAGGGAAYTFRVYLLTGISGGTGSGTFLDMAYLIRDVMHGIGGSVADGTVYGYFFMPDVNNSVSTTDQKEKNDNMRNAYAALQELDYNLGLFELDEHFSLIHPQHKIITTGIDPQGLFDYVHIVSATNSHGALLANATDKANRAIAQNILSFVAHVGIAGLAANGQPVQGFYGNIPNAVASATAGSNVSNRFAGYIAIGSSKYELPIDDMMMYVASLLFKKVDRLFEQVPNQKGFDQFKKALHFDTSSVYTSAVLKVRPLMMPANLTAADLNRSSTDDSYYWINESGVIAKSDALWMGPLVANCHEMASQFIERFDTLMADVFKDPERGPIYVSHLLISAGGVLTQLRTERDLLSNRYFGRNPLQYPSDKDAADNVKKRAMDALRRFKRFGGGSREQKTEVCNATGQEFFKECVWCAIAETIDKEYYSVIEAHIRSQYDSLYSFLDDFLREMSATFSRNAEELVGIPDNSIFQWQELTVRGLSKHLERVFAEVLGKKAGETNALLTVFLNNLWENAALWIRDNNRYDPRKFISEYIDKEFSAIAEESIEDVVAALLNQSGAAAMPLQQSVEQVLMPKLVNAAAPLYYGTANVPHGTQYTLISVPVNCRGILQGVQNFITNTSGMAQTATLQTSTIRNRIYVQTVIAGVQLAGYQTVWNAEQEYAKQYTNSPGVHLYHPINGQVQEGRDWNELYTLIPKALRAKVIGMPPHSMQLVAEEDDQKQRFANLFDADNGYKSLLPMVNLNATSDPWTVNFHISSVEVKKDDDAIRLTMGPEQTEIASWLLKEIVLKGIKTTKEKLRTLVATRDELASLLSGGLLQYGEENTHPLSVPTIKNPVTSLTDGVKTFVNLQELYLRRYMLIKACEAEEKKYALIREALDQVKQEIEAMDQRENAMIAFTYAILAKRIDVLPDMHADMQAQFVGDKGRTNFANLGKLNSNYEKWWKLFLAYADAIKDKGRMGETIRHYRDMAEQSIDSAFKAQDILTVTDLLKKTKALLSEAEDYLENVFKRILNPTESELAAERFYNVWGVTLQEVISIFEAQLTAWGQDSFSPTPTSDLDDDKWDI